MKKQKQKKIRGRERAKLEEGKSKCYAQLRKMRRIMQANQSIRFIVMVRSVTKENNSITTSINVISNVNDRLRNRNVRVKPCRSYIFLFSDSWAKAVYSLLLSASKYSVHFFFKNYLLIFQFCLLKLIENLKSWTKSRGIFRVHFFTS